MKNSIVASETATMYDTLWNIDMKKIKQESSPIMADDLFYEIESQYGTMVAPIELKMLPVECLNINKQLFSGVYRDCSIAQLLTLITEKFNTKTYIHQPDNTIFYDQIIFPPNNIFYAIEHLDQFYGIYNRGLKMFYGFNQAVILPMNYYTETGINKIKIDFSNENQGKLNMTNYLGGGLTEIDDDNLIFIPPSKVKILDKRHYIKETIGNKVSTFSRDEEQLYEQMRNYDYNSNDNENQIEDKVKSYLNRYNNLSKENEFLLKTAYTRQIELMLDGIILKPSDWFKPFDLNFSSPYYYQMNGKYSLKGYYFRLTRIDNSLNNSTYNVNSAIELINV